MSSFGLEALIWPTAAIFFATWVVSFLFIRAPTLSIFVAFVRAGIFLVYFGFVFDGTYTFLDDWGYLAGGYELISEGIGITNLADRWEYALMIGQGDHFVYYLYNAYALRIFGEGYFAPVALNVLLTIAVAYFGTRLAVVEFGMSRQVSTWFYLFLLLHPDILAWSTVINGKDILVLLLHVLLMTAISFYFRGQLHKSLLLGISVVLVLFFLRFYVPILFATALVVGNLLAKRGDWFRYLLLSLGLAIFAFFWVGGDAVQFHIGAIRESPENPIYGFFRILLTPIPFHTSAGYEFLDVPALIHWALMPFLAFGVLHIFRMKSPFSWFFISYFLTFLSLYAAYGELQGPRHRVQLDFALALLQFLGLNAVFWRTQLQASCRMKSSVT